MTYTHPDTVWEAGARICAIMAFLFFILPGLGIAGMDAEAKPRPSHCGGAGERPCKVWEYVPSCEGGLKENLRANRCEPRVRPAHCGGRGEVPCKVWEFIPSCAGGLVENFAAGRCLPNTRPVHCGREGQDPCKLTEFFPSCSGRLVEDFIAGQCIRSEGDIVNMARNTADEVGGFAEAAFNTLLQCGVIALYEAGAKDNGGALAAQIQNKPCFQTLMQEVEALGYQTITIGGAGGASFILGADGENGFAFDTTGRYAPSTYHNLGFKMGFTAGGGASVVLGFYKGTNQTGPAGFGGDGHGATVSGSFGGGAGMAVWYGYNGALNGFTIAANSGAEVEVAYVRNTTEIVSLAGLQPSQVRRTPVAQSTPAPATRQPREESGSITIGPFTIEDGADGDDSDEDFPFAVIFDN